MMQLPDPFGIEEPKQETEKPGVEPTPKYKRDDKTAKFVSELIKVCSNLDHLRIQAHLIHLNYEAANFLGVHKFLKKQYLDHVEQFDRVGEYIRSMDYLLPMCEKGLSSASKEIEHVSSYEPSTMLLTYCNNLTNFAMKLKGIRKQAEKIDAPDVENYIAELIGELFLAAWKIKSMLRN
jgi:DNA-binding ferritin-like protein